MSLVFARKVGDAAYILTDTFSENPLTGVPVHWIMDPCVKVFRIAGYAVAFVGSAFWATRGLDDISGASDLEERLLAVHRESAFAVDFVAVNLRTNVLTRYTKGQREEVEVACLGSASAPEILQTERGSAARHEGTSFGFQCFPLEFPHDLAEIYSSDLAAFRRALANTDGTFGGIAVPFMVWRGTGQFARYADMIRGPLSGSELVSGLSVPVVFSEPNRGEFVFEVWGSDVALAVSFPNNRTGITCVQNGAGYKTVVHRDVDTFDFDRIAKAVGCGDAGGSYGKGPYETLHKAREALRRGEKADAEVLMERAGVQIVNLWKALNPEQEFDFAGGAAFGGRALVTSYQTLFLTSFLVSVRAEVAREGPASAALESAERDRVLWHAWLDALRVNVAWPQLSTLSDPASGSAKSQ